MPTLLPVEAKDFSRYSRRKKTPLTVLGLTVREAFPGRGKLSELMTDHLVGDGQWGVVLPVVNLELEANKGGDDCAGAGVGADRDVLGQSLSETREGDEEWTFPGGSSHGG